MLIERRVSGTAIVIVLSVALLFGSVGFAFHTFWVVATLAIVLGLGYVLANARQDHQETVDRR